MREFFHDYDNGLLRIGEGLLGWCFQIYHYEGIAGLNHVYRSSTPRIYRTQTEAYASALSAGLILKEIRRSCTSRVPK